MHPSRTCPRIFRIVRAVIRAVIRAVQYLPGRTAMLKSVGFGGLGLVLLWQGWSVLATLLFLFIAYVATGGWRFMRVVIATLPRDARGLMMLIYMKWKIRKHTAAGDTIVDVFRETVSRHPNKLAFILVDGHQMTFRQVDEYSNRVGNYFHQLGYKQGDTIAMFMENSPEYVCLWLGMAKVGITPALINFNLRMESLTHCIKASNARCVIFSSTYENAMAEAKPLLAPGTQLYCHGDYKSSGVNSLYLNPLISRSSCLPPPRIHKTRFNDKLFYIYTSGTTGLPKAAIVIHSRYFYMSVTTHHFFYMNSDDVIYDTLPLYHTAGGILGTGQAIIKGCTVVIRKKFSASRFWDDCVRYNCSVVQYIGEICRYLLAQPQRPTESQQRVRVAFGNGLRPQIWKQFQQRFGIERIGEFYGATEGNANIVNIDNTVGAVGFCTMIIPALYPVTLIRVDEVTGQPLRDSTGLCIKCLPGQPGELVGKIVKGDPLREFDGYANEEATKRKIAKNVFHHGDRAFLTGDILVMDEYGYMFFRDRTGDTFRWRGENVSSAEVEATISSILKLTDAVVYGVEVPGSEGRAGMVAILDEEHQVDLNALYCDLQKALPPYAHPLFVRMLRKLDTTGTFKLKKADYRKDGFDPNKVSDKMFFLDTKAKEYKSLTPAVFTQIQHGLIRL